MKIRIQDHSIRFRMTLKEVDALRCEGSIQRTCHVTDETPAFTYSVRLGRAGVESHVVQEPYGIHFVLSPDDAARLFDPCEEGVYLRREWTDEAGAVHRFMAFAEKDRPGSRCEKPEAWIYDAPPHGTYETRPIPQRAGAAN